MSIQMVDDVKLRSAVKLLSEAKDDFVSSNEKLLDDEKDLVAAVDLILEYFNFVFNVFDKKVGKKNARKS